MLLPQGSLLASDNLQLRDWAQRWWPWFQLHSMVVSSITYPSVPGIPELHSLLWKLPFYSYTFDLVYCLFFFFQSTWRPSLSCACLASLRTVDDRSIWELVESLVSSTGELSDSFRSFWARTCFTKSMLTLLLCPQIIHTSPVLFFIIVCR